MRQADPLPSVPPPPFNSPEGGWYRSGGSGRGGGRRTCIPRAAHYCRAVPSSRSHLFRVSKFSSRRGTPRTQAARALIAPFPAFLPRCSRRPASRAGGIAFGRPS